MKKSSSFIIIAILLCLVGLSVYIFVSKSGLSTVNDEIHTFRYRDTAAITRIFIADKDGNQSDLRRTRQGWMVNEKYNCRSEAILNLLEVIKLVEVKMPVPKTLRETTIKYLAGQAIKVQVYTGDKLVRQYYVGHEAEDSEGSYMLQTDVRTGKNHKDPYVCFIAGFKGYLLPRFIVSENDWRDRLVMNFTPPEIRQVRLTHHGIPADSSFTIDLEDANHFRLKDGHGREIKFDDEKMRQYLVYLQNISYEFLLTGKNEKLHDSLRRVGPFCTMKITTRDDKESTYNFYRKQFLGDINPEHGVTYDHDPDRLYLSFEQDKEWALIQYFVFGKMLIPTEYFLPDKSVKK
jgi:hypothetical protein